MLHVEHSSILLTFVKLLIAIKIFVLSIFEWPFYTGFTVYSILPNKSMCFYSLASGSELKVNYYWTKLFSDIISLLGCNSDSPIREVHCRILENRTPAAKV